MALTSGKVSMTAHIVYAPEIGPDELLKTLKLLLADRFSIFIRRCNWRLLPVSTASMGATSWIIATKNRVLNQTKPQPGRRD